MYELKLRTIAAKYGVVPPTTSLRAAIKLARKEERNDVVCIEVREKETGRLVAKKVTGGSWKFSRWVDLWHAKFGIEI